MTKPKKAARIIDRAGENLVSAVRGWQLDGLLKAYETGAGVAMASMEGVRLYAQCSGHDVQVLKKFPDERVAAFAIIDPTIPDYAECWVHIDERQYAIVFYDFLIRYFGFPEHTRFPRSVQIDHVFSVHMCRSEGMKYVRLAPITQRGNSHSGSREYQFVKNQAGNPPYDAENVFGLTEAEWNGVGVRTPTAGSLEFRSLWTPVLVKLLPEFHPPPTGKMMTLDVLEALRVLHIRGLLHHTDLESPFGAVLATFRMYAARIPHYDGIKRSSALAKDGDGKILTCYDPVETWLNAKDLEDLEPVDHWPLSNGIVETDHVE